MTVRYRLMKPQDVPQCVNGIAAHPVLGPRYGGLIEYLPSAIRYVFDRDSFGAQVFEEFHGSATRFLGAGMAAFVSDDFLRELKTTPLFWAGPELVKRIVSGNSPLLSDAQVREANSTVGLNLLVWHNTVFPADIRDPEVGTPLMSAFEEYYRGYRLRELIGQADCWEHLLGMRNVGGLYYHQNENHYGSFPDVGEQDFTKEPRNSGMSRDLALSHAHGGTWVGSMFVFYTPPQFCFSRSEQRLLAAALEGGTDAEMSDQLGVSLFAVKKTWRLIYDRVAACQPQLVPSNSHADAWAQGRGKEKKQRLLAYLRKHPEELRPSSRKLLYQESTQRLDSTGFKSSIGAGA